MSKFSGAKAKPSKFGVKPEAAPKPIDNDRLAPTFSFEHMFEGNGYSVTCCNSDHKAALAARLFLLSKVTWLEIRQAPRHGIGSEKIARNAIQTPLPSRVTDDVELIALRYNGKHPMVGFRLW